MSTGSTSVLELVDPSTDRRREIQLVGVDIDDLDVETPSIVIGYIARSAETDLTLPQRESNCLSLRYPVTEAGAEEHPRRAQDVIVDRLKAHGDLVESLVIKDRDIKRYDEEVIRDAFPPQDDGDGEGEDQPDDNAVVRPSGIGFQGFQKIRDHLLEIFRMLIPRERIATCTPDKAVRLLIDFALLTKYCYNFIKRLVEHAREVLRNFLPSTVYDILGHVTSAVFSHLVDIQWKAAVQRLGGWVALAGSLALTHVYQVAIQKYIGNSLTVSRTFMGISVLSAIIGLGTYFYYGR